MRTRFFLLRSVISIFTLSLSLAPAGRQAHCTLQTWHSPNTCIDFMLCIQDVGDSVAQHKFDYTPENVRGFFLRTKFIHDLLLFARRNTIFHKNPFSNEYIDRVNKPPELNKSQQFHTTQRLQKCKHIPDDTMSINRFTPFYQIVKTRSRN